MNPFKALTLDGLKADPASLLRLNPEDPLLRKLEMLRLLQLGHDAESVARVFGLKSVQALRSLLDQLREEGSSALLGDAEEESGRPTWDDTTAGHIIAAAVQVFSERGYQGATMRDIAKLAGIRAPSIYNHFPTKQSILFHIMRETMESLHEQVGLALSHAGSHPADRLGAFVRAHILFHINHAMEAGITDTELRSLEPENHALIVRLRDEYEGMLRVVLEDGVGQGVFRETSVKLCSIAILTMCTAVSLWYRRDGPLSPEDIAGTYAGYAARIAGFDGVAADAPPDEHPRARAKRTG